MLPRKAMSFNTDTLGMLSIQKMCQIFHNSSLWIALRVPGTCFLTFSVVTTLQSFRTGFENVKQTGKKKRKSYLELSLKNEVIIALLEPHLRCDYPIKNMIFPPFLPLSLPLLPYSPHPSLSPPSPPCSTLFFLAREVLLWRKFQKCFQHGKFINQ